MKHSGRIFKVMGDGFLVEFNSVLNAARCAVEIQRGMVERNAGVPDDRHIKVRIGINLGDVMVEGADIFGDGVNIAARLEALAEPGGIVVSATVHDHVTGKLELSFEDLGERTLKNIQKPVRIYRARQQVQITADPAARDSNVWASIAILPFTNLSGKPGQQYLSDGITEDIIIRLARFKELKVAARTAAFRFQGGSVSSTEAGQSLGARYVVQGTALKNGNRLIISCQLVEAASGNLLWGERYDREATDIFSVQDDVVARIVTSLGGRVVTADAVSARQKPTENWSAYDFFLRGRNLCNAGRESASEPFFAKAIAYDPDFALVHAWHAVALIGMYWDTADQGALNRGFESASNALTLDPNESTAHHAAGMALNYLRKYDRAAYHFGRAIELNPLDVNIRGDYSSLLLHTGRYAEALSTVEEVLKRDPYPPVWLHYAHGRGLFFLKRFQEAIGVLQNIGVYHFRTRGLLAASHQILGNAEEARHEISLMREANPNVSFKLFEATMTFADRTVLDFFFDALRKAGFDG